MENKPLSPWSYFGLEILYNIPIVGLVFLIIHAIGAQNINKRNFARSYFCFVIIFVVILAVAVATGLVAQVIDMFKGMYA